MAQEANIRFEDDFFRNLSFFRGSLIQLASNQQIKYKSTDKFDDSNGSHIGLEDLHDLLDRLVIFSSLLGHILIRFPII